MTSKKNTKTFSTEQKKNQNTQSDLKINEIEQTTGDWDIFLGPPERARAETGGADQWVIKRRECSGFARVNKVTSALEYPLSVFKKNSTLNQPTERLLAVWRHIYQTKNQKPELN
jgi:hypothetical protein